MTELDELRLRVERVKRLICGALSDIRDAAREIDADDDPVVARSLGDADEALTIAAEVLQ